MPNLKLRAKKDLSSFRRMALGTWKNAYDPSVYGSLVLPMDEALRYMAEFTQKTGRRITITHLMAKAVGGVLAKIPDANAIIRWNRIYLRDEVGVFFQVETRDEENGEIDLTGATVYQPEQKTMVQIVDEFDARVKEVRAKKDRQLEKSRGLVQRVPHLFLNSFMKVYSFFIYTLNIDPKHFDAPKDAFGSAMVTNVGSLGLEEAFVPLVPFSRVPLLLALGKISDAVVADGGAPVVKKQMKVFATFDHRILDGAHAAAMSKALRTWFEDPYTHFGDIDQQLEGAPESSSGSASSREPSSGPRIKDGSDGGGGDAKMG